MKKNSSGINIDIEAKALKFEKKNGTEAFLKLCISSLNKILISSGLVTEGELKETLSKEIDEWIEEK